MGDGEGMCYMMNVIFDVNRYINKTYHIVRLSFISSCCCKAESTW